MYIIYLIQSVNTPDQRYIGFTTNLNQRLKDHNHGKSSHTSKYKPWQLIMCFAFKEQLKATDFEKYLKSGSGRALAKKHFW